VWVNGQLVHEAKVGRPCTPRQDTFTFPLKKGLNPILVKICENWGDWAFVVEVFTNEYLALESKRPLVRALDDIQRLDQGRNLSRIGRPVPPPVEEIRKGFPFVVVTPQCPDEYDAWPSDLLIDLIDDVDTRKMVEDLKACGGNVRFTVYEGAGHGITARVYHTKELYDWLLQQRND
jgi:hypothetical protein